jgi:hypothetical protein
MPMVADSSDLRILRRYTCSALEGAPAGLGSVPPVGWVPRRIAALARPGN